MLDSLKNNQLINRAYNIQLIAFHFTHSLIQLIDFEGLTFIYDKINVNYDYIHSLEVK